MGFGEVRDSDGGDELLTDSSSDTVAELEGACDILSVRRRNYGYNAALSYDEPLTIVRGGGTYLFDHNGVQYLDCVNNVAHLGHCHPKVTAAVCDQLWMVNTNSRYLHPLLTRYTTRLLEKFPEDLKVLYLVNSGSEANDLALRIAQHYRPGAQHVVVMAGAYHGHTSSLIPLSPYKFWGPGGQGQANWVHVLPAPDIYRGENLDGGALARAVVDEVHEAGGRVCAFFCESIISCGGQLMLPEGYLQAVYKVMREEGALCVADEVQCGFGRVGSSFWAFEGQGVVPDIVTLGKPIGNGFPLGAAVVKEQIAQTFCSGMDYFNTFGGCTAACAAGLSVLEVLEDEGLQYHAAHVGQYLMTELQKLTEEFPDIVGDVRGLGLFLGVEIVRDAHHKTPAPRAAKWIKEEMKRRGVLLSTDGPFENVIKIKPPMVFGQVEADLLARELRSTLRLLNKSEQQLDLVKEDERYFQTVLHPRWALYAKNKQRLVRRVGDCVMETVDGATCGAPVAQAGV